MFSSTKLLAVLLCVFGIVSQVKAQSKIVGGTATSIAEFNYMVQIYVNNGFICGGSLVRPTFVLTAAHCTQGNKYTQYKIKGGATNLSSTGVTRTVKRVVRPKSYNKQTMDQDWALLQLASALTGTNIGTIELNTVTVPSGATLVVAGWGATSENGGTSNRLQKVELSYVARSTCKNLFSKGEITNNMICAKKTNKDSCYGDSGGPLVYNNRIAGIVSWGYGCAGTLPGVYTDVSAVATSITNAMNNFESQ